MTPLLLKGNTHSWPMRRHSALTACASMDQCLVFCWTTFKCGNLQGHHPAAAEGRVMPVLHKGNSTLANAIALSADCMRQDRAVPGVLPDKLRLRQPGGLLCRAGRRAAMGRATRERQGEPLLLRRSGRRAQYRGAPRSPPGEDLGFCDGWICVVLAGARSTEGRRQALQVPFLC